MGIKTVIAKIIHEFGSEHFLETYGPWPEIGDIDRLKFHIEAIQKKVRQELKLESESECELIIHGDTIKNFLESATTGCKLILRHGGQDSGEAVAGHDVASRKIIQMKKLNNLNDSITPSSAIDFIGTLVVFKYLKEKHNIKFIIRSSENKRALHPAKLLAKVLATNWIKSHELTCVNYPNKSIEELKQQMPDGKLSWSQEQVDLICGEDTFRTITSNMLKLTASKVNPAEVQLYITHTQQINAIYTTLNEEEDIGRLECYGFVGITSGATTFFDKQGFVETQPSSQIARPGYQSPTL